MIVSRVDKDGYFVEDVEVLDSEVLPKDCISEPLDTSEKGYYKPKWNGAEWIETMTREDFEDLNSQPEEPTEIEILAKNVYEMAEILELILLGGTE